MGLESLRVIGNGIRNGMDESLWKAGLHLELDGHSILDST